MRTPTAIFLILLAALAAGCANRQPTLSEIRIQSRPSADALAALTAMAPGTAPAMAPAQPFCLHMRYANEFKYVYSQNSAEAWVTDGACDADGPRRSVSQLVVRWRYQYDMPGSKTCSAADSCLLDEKSPGEGRRLACVSASARDRGQEAAATTDAYACAR